MQIKFTIRDLVKRISELQNIHPDNQVIFTLIDSKGDDFQLNLKRIYIGNDIHSELIKVFEFQLNFIDEK